MFVFVTVGRSVLGAWSNAMTPPRPQVQKSVRKEKARGLKGPFSENMWYQTLNRIPKHPNQKCHHTFSSHSNVPLHMPPVDTLVAKWKGIF